MLWAHHPLFGDFFLSNMHIKCPFTVPFLPKKKSDQSELDYMSSLGYFIKSNDQPESDESYNDRMYQTVSLYSAVIQCNITEVAHPCDVDQAWRWLANIVNSPPLPDTTALIMDAFLSYSAHKMYTVYRKQFVKLFRFISTSYLSKINSVTKVGDRGHLTKFESLLTDLNKNQFLIHNDNVPDYFFTKSYIFKSKTKFI